MSGLHPWNEALWRGLGMPARVQPAAMLLVGPRGVAKTAFSLHLAQALLCSEPNADGEACGTCQSCRLYLAGNHPDFRLLQATKVLEGERTPESEAGRSPTGGASSAWIRVDQVRALGELLELRPHLGGRRVVVVDRAERLHASAANALLKTLEEPPQGVHFILVTGSPGQLPPTVLSRCVRLTFTLPSASVATAWLAAQGAERPALALAQAGFAPLSALELDTPEYWSKRAGLIDMVLAKRDFDPVSAVDRLGSEDLAFLVGSLQRWVYDLVLLASTRTIRYNPDCAQILHSFAGKLDLLGTMQLVRELQSAVRFLDHPLNPRLVAERCLIGYKRALN